MSLSLWALPNEAMSGVVPHALWLAVAVVVSALASMVTLGLASRLGVHDVRQWITPQMRLQLRSVGIGWLIVAAIAAGAVAWAAESWIAALMRDALMGPSLTLVLPGLAGMLCGVFAGLLVTLARIDLACRLLPDRLTICLVITGLMFHFLVPAIHPIDALIGASLGYGALWLLALAFRRTRGIDPIGRGDFAMTAGLGAWLGWQTLPLMLAIASGAALIAIAVNRLFIASAAISPSAGSSGFFETQAAFGPALAAGGVLAWMILGTGVWLG